MIFSVIKIGGEIIEDPSALSALPDALSKAGGVPLIVHGGGRRATSISSALGIPTNMVEGRRVTDKPTLDVVTMVYAGLVNKTIVCALQNAGYNALGLCGADMRCISGKRRPPVEVAMPDGGTAAVDFGYVGCDLNVDAGSLVSFLENGIVPVISPLVYDGEGGLLNTNADTVATDVATALAAGGDEVNLYYCFGGEGVLGSSGVICSIDRSEYAALKQSGVVSGGMIPKLDNAFRALDVGVDEVYITSLAGLLRGTRVTL